MANNSLNIGICRALWGSFIGSELAHYPRRAKDTIPSKEMMDKIQRALGNFDFEIDETKPLDPKLLLDRAKDSLEEVKKQTEYQDGKAGRLLTIVAFLTAAVGTVFSKFVDIYPLQDSLALGGWTSVCVASTYLMFGVYLLFVAGGAMVTFHAMTTRFVWPGDSNLADLDQARSFLFFQQIIRTTPEAWGNAFAGDKKALLRDYYKHYVAEAYLVAAKVADKLRYLDPGQRLLLGGVRVLLALFILVMITFASIPSPSAKSGGTGKSATTAAPDKLQKTVLASGTTANQLPTSPASATLPAGVKK